MAKDNAELKSEAFIAQHELRGKITLSDKGIFEGLEDLHEQIVLAGSGVTVDQLKKMQKLEGELLPAVTLVSGELARDHFKANAESNELGFSYKIGNTTTASGVFNRDNDGKVTIVNAVESKFNGAEMKRVHTHLGSLFDDINN